MFPVFRYLMDYHYYFSVEVYVTDASYNYFKLHNFEKLNSINN